MGTRRPAIVAVIACFAAAASSAAAQNTATTTLAFSQVDCPGSFATQATDINNYGKVVGFCTDTLGTHGFQFEGGRLSLIDVPGAVETEAIAANSVGMVVGSYLDLKGQQHGFLLRETTFTKIDVPANLGTNTLPTGVNNAGDIVGNYQGPNFTVQSFLRHNEQFQPIVFPGSVSTAVYSANVALQTVGFYFASDFLTHGFIDSGGVFATIDDPNGMVTIPTSINRVGHILGYYEGSDVQTHIFLFENGIFQTIDLQGGTLTILHFERFAINDREQIAGSYQDAVGKIHGFVAQLPQAGGSAH